MQVPNRFGSEKRGRIGLGNLPRESELDEDLPLEEVWQEGRPLLRVGVGQKIGSERWSRLDRSKGADRIGGREQDGSEQADKSNRKNQIG